MRVLEPFVLLVGRLTYRNKLRMTAAVFGIPLLVAAGIIVFELQQREFDLRLERAALALQTPTLALLADLHHLFATTQATRLGATSLQEQIKSRNQQLQTDLSALRRMLALHADALQIPDDGAQWPLNWDELAREIEEADAEALASLHVRVVRQLRDQLDAVNDQSRLLLDSSMTGNRLISVLTGQLPGLIDSTGEASRLGVGVLVKQRLKGSRRNELTLIRGNFNPLVQWCLDALQRAGRDRAELSAPLEEISSRLNTAYLGIQEAITTKMLETTDFDMPVDAYLALTGKALDESVELSRTLSEHIDHLLAERLAQLQAVRNAVVLVIALLFCGLFVVFIAAYVSIMRGIHGLGHAVSTLTRGDLRARVELSSDDELAQVGQQFNRMGENFAGVIRSTSAAATSVTVAATQMSRGSAQVRDGSDRQRRAAETIATTIDGLTLSISHVAEHATATAGIANQAAMIASHEESRARNAIADMKGIITAVQETAAQIRQLDARSREIEQIVQVIQEIADQTNLLALNAAIEAARAGESGRGFAVVADEVRKLADRTGQSTRDIDRMVGAIQTDTHQVVVSMDGASQNIGQSAAMIEELAGAMNLLRGAVDESARHVSDIVQATQAERVSSQAIAQEVKAMADLAEVNHAALAAGAQTADELSALAERLRLSVAGLQTD